MGSAIWIDVFTDVHKALEECDKLNDRESRHGEEYMVEACYRRDLEEEWEEQLKQKRL